MPVRRLTNGQHSKGPGSADCPCHCHHIMMDSDSASPDDTPTFPVGPQPGQCRPCAQHSGHLHLISPNPHPRLVCSGGKAVTSRPDLGPCPPLLLSSCTTWDSPLKCPVSNLERNTTVPGSVTEGASTDGRRGSERLQSRSRGIQEEGPTARGPSIKALRRAAPRCREHVCGEHGRRGNSVSWLD